MSQIKVVVDGQYLSTLLDLIESARESIGMIHLTFDSERGDGAQVARALGDAAARGVSVVGVLDGHIRGVGRRNEVARDLLAEHGICLRVKRDGTVVHAKAIVIDERTVLVGSTNLTRPSLGRNHEANVLIESPRAAKALMAYVETLRDGDSFWTADFDKIPLECSKTALLVHGGFFESVLRMVEEARESLVIATYMMDLGNDNACKRLTRLRKSLVAAVERGVDLHIVLEQSGHSRRVNRMARATQDYFTDAGISTIRWNDPTTITHAKVVVKDGVEAVIGSTNWYGPGMSESRQVDVVTRCEETVSRLKTYVKDIWSRASPIPSSSSNGLNHRAEAPET